MRRIIYLLIFFLVIIILLSQRSDYGSQTTETFGDYVADDDSYQTVRANMVEEHLIARDIDDQTVLDVMGKVPRHLFVPENVKDKAYGDHPLPIGHGQTISQPYIVALMTQTLQLNEDDKVLEIGTGSGYQAAVLAEIVNQVHTIEIVEPLALAAEERLQALGYDNVNVKHADGYYGWEEYAPFDAIIVTAAANHVPPPLLNQLVEGGRLIIPLGDTLRFQTLTIITKEGEDLDTRFITGVRFVPMTGKAKD